MRMQCEREPGQVPATSANNSKSHTLAAATAQTGPSYLRVQEGRGHATSPAKPLAAWQPHGLTGSGVGAHSRRSTAACTLPPVATRARMLASLHGTWACSQQAKQRQKQHSTPAREWYCSLNQSVALFKTLGNCHPPDIHPASTCNPTAQAGASTPAQAARSTST